MEQHEKGFIIRPAVVAVTYAFPVTTQTFHYRRLRVMHEEGVLNSIRYVRNANGIVDDRDASVMGEARLISRQRLVPALLRCAVKVSVMRNIGAGLVKARRSNGEGGRIGFLWQALHGLALGLEHRQSRNVVFHAMFNEAAGTVAMFASLASGRPWSVEVHAPLSLRSNPRLLAHKLNHADLVVAISSYMADSIQRISSPRRLEIVHCGIDLDRFPFLPRDHPTSEVPKVMSVGSLIDKKGHDTLIKASSLLVTRLAHTVTIIGEGHRRSSLEAASHEGSSPVELLGQINPHDVREFVASSDVFVLACKLTDDGNEDGIPVALMEAMALGVPVVSTRIAGIPELLDDGSAGFLCSPDDSEALAQQIESALTNVALRNEVVHKARARIETHFSNSHETKQLVELLSRVVSPTEVLFFSSNPHIGVDDSSGAGNHIRGIIGGFQNLGTNVTTVMGKDARSEVRSSPDHISQPVVPTSRSMKSTLRSRFPRMWESIRSLSIATHEISMGKRLRRAARQKRPDLVYERLSNWQFTSTSATRRRRIPHIIEVNALPGGESPNVSRRLKRIQLRLAQFKLSHATALVAVSSPLRDDLESTFDRLPPIVVVPNAAPPVVAASRPDRGPNGVHFVFAGSMRHWHRLDLLIRAIALLPREIRDRVHFHLAGEGPMLESTILLAEELEVGGDVTFHGLLSQTDLKDLYSRCDVGVLPWNAPYQSPTKLLEYASHGLAIIAPRLAGVEDLFGDDDTALLIDGDVESMVAAIIRMLDGGTRTRLAKQATMMAADWTWDRAVERILKSTFEQL